MKIKEDARVKKTKEKLFRAFQTLLAENQFEEITIQEICSKAEIRRATFYKHFTDKYDFLAAMTAALIQRFDAKMRRSKISGFPVEYHIEYEKKLVRFLIENEDIVNLVFKSNMMPTLVAIIVHEHNNVLINRLTHSVENGETLVAPVSTVATLLAGGIGNVIITWFKDGKPTSEDELTANIECLVRAMFVK